MAETRFGFNRQAVQRGLAELELNKPIRPACERLGRPRVEVDDPRLSQAADKLLSASSQADPKFYTSFGYTHMTAESIRQALADELQIPLSQLPAPRTN